MIPVCEPLLTGKELEYVTDCLKTNWISSAGKYIAEFEKGFAAYCGSKHGITTTSGTTALHLALAALGIGKGDDVIIPTLTMAACAFSVIYTGAKPVLVDSEPRTMNLDPEQVARRITPRTRAIIAVHLYGHPADMDPLLQIAFRRGLSVIEDAAEAHGALYRGREVGGLGHVAAFSFFGNKIITTGEGGMVTTRDEDLGRKVRILRGQGMDPDRRYWFPVVGYNYRMTNIQAAIGLAQVEQFAQHRDGRRQVAGWYDRHLSGLADFLRLPVEESWARHAFWTYTVLLRDGSGVTRDEIMARLAEQGIETRPAFYPMHLMPPYAEPEGRYPVAESLGRRGISLPMHSLLTEGDVAYIADCIRSCRP